MYMRWHQASGAPVGGRQAVAVAGLRGRVVMRRASERTRPTHYRELAKKCDLGYGGTLRAIGEPETANHHELKVLFAVRRWFLLPFASLRSFIRCCCCFN